MVKRVAVILSGCGVYDGTEIHEASAVLVHLSRADAKVRDVNLLQCIYLLFYVQLVAFRGTLQLLRVLFNPLIYL